MFRYETELVSTFQQSLNESNNPFDLSGIAFEFDYRNGRTDIVGLRGKSVLIAFEAKLVKWKIALFQAYRNSSFAHYSYVLLPEATVKNAIRNRAEFDRRGIGLCAISSSKIKVLIKAKKRKPIQPWLTETALDYINHTNHADSR